MSQNKYKRRSSLRKVVNVDKDDGVEGDNTTVTTNRNSTIKRRISFSGKKFVREFINTEKPHEWDNSYELSDHTCGEDSAATGIGAKSTVSLVSIQNKENVPLSSFLGDSTFNLQTSIDITLLPNELKRRAGTDAVTGRPIEPSSVSLTSSLFLSPAIRDQCLKYPILDKTVDLLPDCMKPTQKEEKLNLDIQPVSKESVIPTLAMGTTKPVLPSSKDVPVDQVNNLPDQSSDEILMSKNPIKSNIWESSMDINDLCLDSIHSSPLIPMDMISVQGMKGPMSLRQLNEAIEAGNIRVCPDGPKTPTTDRKGIRERYYKRFEGEDIEHNAHENSIRRIKPRSTLNFSESIITSPPAPVCNRFAPEDKRKYNYSQADEMLLDNTNFLAHARLGDETDSQNGSRQVEPTEMSNNISKIDLEYKVNFGEALRQTAFRFLSNQPTLAKQMQNLNKYMEQENVTTLSSDFEMKSNPNDALPECQTGHLEHKVNLAGKNEHQQTHFKSMKSQSTQMTESINNDLHHPGQPRESRNTLLLADPIEEDVENLPMHSLMKHTIHRVQNDFSKTKAMEDNLVFLQKDLPTSTYAGRLKSKTRNNLLLEEGIEQDVEVSSQLSPARSIAKQEKYKPMNSILMSESIEPDSESSPDDLPVTPLIKDLKCKARRTLLLSEPIEEDRLTSGEADFQVLLPKNKITEPRSSLNMEEHEEKAFVTSQKDVVAISPIPNVKSKNTNTALLTEPVEWDLMIGDKNLTKGNRPKARSTLHLTETIEEDIVVPHNNYSAVAAVGNLKSKSRNTSVQPKPMEEDLAIPNDSDPNVPLINHRNPKPRSTLLMAEPIEEDLDGPHIPQTDSLKSKSRNTSHLTELVEVNFTVGSENLTKGNRSKPRNTSVLTEPIEEDIVPPHNDLVESKSRNTLLLQKTMDKGLATPRDDDPKILLINQRNRKPRSTLHMVEPMEEDLVGLHKDLGTTAPTESLKSNNRNTLHLTELVEVDLIVGSENLKKGNISTSNDDDPKILLTNQRNRKPRSTLHMVEPMEEDLVGLHKDLGTTAPTESLKSNNRNTLHLTELLEVDLIVGSENLKKGNISTSNDDDPKILLINPRNRKPRCTLHMVEPMEEDLVSLHKDLATTAPTESFKSKNRNTLHLAELVEADLMVGSENLTNGNRSKPRNTSVLIEPIEEDIVPPHNDLVESKSRNTLLLQKTMEKGLATPSDDDPKILLINPRNRKPRSTLHMVEPMEEDLIASNKDSPTIPQTESLVSKMRKSLHLTEPAEGDFVTPSQNLTKITRCKARSTLCMAEAIEEDGNIVDETTIGNVISKSRKTLILEEPIDLYVNPAESEPKFRTIVKAPVGIAEDLPVSEDEVALDGYFPKSTEHRKFKARQTLLLAEEIEEDFSAREPFQQDQNSKLRNTLIESTLSAVPLPAISRNIKNNDEQDYNTANQRLHKLQTAHQQSQIDSDIVTTPQNRPKRACFTMTPCRSLIEFEDVEEEMEAMEIPQKSVVLGAPGINTPLSKAKRSHIQLTPNLPQPKKHHGLFHDHTNVSQEQVFDVDETVQVLRAARRSQYLCEDKSSCIVNDKSITISDVSNNFGHTERKSAEWETLRGDIQTYNKFINITGDTVVIPLMDESSQQEIEEVRLSLVSNLLEDDIDKDDPNLDLDQLPSSASDVAEKEACLEMTLGAPIEAGTTSSCRKCRNCRRSLGSNATLNSSFGLSPIKKWDITRDLERLEKVRQRPHFTEIHKYFYLKEQEVCIASEEEEDSIAEQTQLEEPSFTCNIKCSEMMQLFQALPQRIKLHEKPIQHEEFLESLDFRLAREQPEWIFDYQLRISKKLLLTHRQFSHIFRMVMLYDFLDETSMTIRVTSIYIEPTRPPVSWLPFDHILNFQLGLKLPVKLLDSLEGHDVESMVQFLKQINKICSDIKKRVRQLAKIITSSISTLIRQQLRTVVKKTSYIIPPTSPDGILRIKEIQFMVEINNLEEISFKDILQPQLYMFDENIQYLPKGVAFLESFLPNPEKYLKSSGIQ